MNGPDKIKEFGLWLSQKREACGYSSQRQLALKSGISPATISRIEAGTQKAEPSTLAKLAPFLGMTYEELMVKAGYLPNIKTDPNHPGRTDEIEAIEEATARAEKMIADAVADDPELLEFWQELTKRDDLQLLFKQVRDLPPVTIKRIIRYIKMVEDEEADE